MHPSHSSIGDSMDNLPSEGQQDSTGWREKQTNYTGTKKKNLKIIIISTNPIKKTLAEPPRSSSSIIKDFAPFPDFFCIHPSCLCQCPPETTCLQNVPQSGSLGHRAQVKDREGDNDRPNYHPAKQKLITNRRD